MYGARRASAGVAVFDDAQVEMDDVQRVEQLALVLVDALDLDVEERVGIDRDARSSRWMSFASRSLLRALHVRGTAARNAGVVGERLELAQARRGR